MLFVFWDVDKSGWFVSWLLCGLVFLIFGDWVGCCCDVVGCFGLWFIFVCC